LERGGVWQCRERKKLLLEDLWVPEGLEEGRVLSEEEKLRKAIVINDL
jgi:hypothetical protein